MKIQILLGLLQLMVSVEASQTCLYCKRVDTNAGFLYSYSYCPDQKNERCLADAWNYVNPNMQCLTDLKEGWTLDIDNDCFVRDDPGACKNFESSQEFYGTYVNSTLTLKDNSKCTIAVDATAAPARVIFDNAPNLGVMYPGYIIG